MLHVEASGLLAGAILLGAVHGIEPGHGWPVAASYALDRPNKWRYGLAASLVIGVGHLVSSVAMVAVFFYAKSYFQLSTVNDPVTVAGGVQIGGPVSIVAGVLLVALGVREYTHGHHHHGHGDGSGHGDSEQDHGHGHEPGHDHDHPDHSHHHHGHDHSGGGIAARIAGWLPFGDDDADSPEHLDDAADRGLFGIAWFAFLLGFAHEEEFEIIALCTGSVYCLELMLAYALTVIAGIVGLTMLLIAGYERSEERVERLTPYLPMVSAVVLVTMGLGFVAGVF